MNIFDEIKNRITVIDYAKSNGLPVKEEEDRTASFIDPGNNKTCVVYYTNWWFDFKTKEHGDVIDLCAILEHNGNIGDAIRELKVQLGIVGEFKLNTDLERNVNGWHKELLKHPEYIEYLHSRNITDETIEDLKLGFDKKWSRITIPFYKHGYPVNCIGRTVKKVTDKNPKYFKSSSSNGYMNVLWGLDTLNRDTPLIITEGAFDALSFYQEKYAVLSLMGTCISNQQKRDLISISKKFDYVILAFDNDQPGKDATLEYANYLLSYNIPFKVLIIPKSFDGVPVKDVSDYYTQAKELDSLVNNDSVEDLNYFIKVYKDKSKEEFKKFAYKLARIKENEDIDQFFDLAKKITKFEESWLNSLSKSVRNPKQNIVRDEIVKAYELVYNPDLNFHKFNGEIWEYKVDRDIQQLIDKHLGNTANKTLVNNVLDLVKNEVNANVEFNKKNIITFQNGVLELDSGVFRSFNKNDYSTIQLGYEYNPDSECLKFNEYLDEVTDSNHEKKQLIQEMTGYCLFPENTLHKAFFLIGSGGNGKSVYFKVIEGLFGLDNVSHVALSGLKSEFQRIRLKYSLVNIQGDFIYHKNILETSDVFKSITANETINGCYKQKQFVDFISRAKLFFGANEMFKTNDSSDGMKRRIIFVEFPVKFVENPTKPNEKKIDPDLKDKLMEELPGIFNWAYEGYKRLKKNGKFTKTEEQERLMEEFLSSIDPVIAYINDLDLKDRDIIFNKDEFKRFRLWCEENNEVNKLSQKTFSGRFRKAFLERNPDWEQGHSGNKKFLRKKPLKF